MTNDRLAQARFIEGEYRSILRLIAAEHGLNAEGLLSKVPSFPANPFEPGQVQATFNEIEVTAEGLNEKELQVIALAGKTMAEVLWIKIKERFPDLPEFGTE